MKFDDLWFQLDVSVDEVISYFDADPDAAEEFVASLNDTERQQLCMRLLERVTGEPG